MSGIDNNDVFERLEQARSQHPHMTMEVNFSSISVLCTIYVPSMQYQGLERTLAGAQRAALDKLEADINADGE